MIKNFLKKINRKFRLFLCFIFFKLSYKLSIEKNYKWAYKLKLINKKDCSPLTCHKCLGEQFEEKILDSIGYTVCEIEIKCKNCNTFVGCWLYGYYQPWFH